MVGHVERFNPAVRELKRRISDGQLGRINQARARRVGPFFRRERDVGVAYDLATHDIDVLHFLLECDVERVQAETQSGIRTEYEDALTGVLRFENGAVAQLEASWITPIKQRELVLLGERGMFALDYIARTLVFYSHADDAEGEGEPIEIPAAAVEPLRLEIEAFVRRAATRGAGRQRGRRHRRRACRGGARRGGTDGPIGPCCRRKAGEVKVAVVGLGKIGLPLAVQYASRGLSAAGYDIDAAKVESINSGCCPIVGEEGLEEGLKAALANGRLRATTNPGEAISGAEVVVLIVPVGLTPKRAPDFTYLDMATHAIASHLGAGTLVVVESTVPVGTTRDRAGAALGRTTLLAASPERVSSGRIFRDLRTYPKIVGAINDASWAQAEVFYSAALEAPAIIRVRDLETAEFVKLAEGIYRDVNIALASELARYADSAGVNAAEAFAAANTQPYAHLHQAGVGVGGHCLPVYPYFLPQDGTTQLPRLARETNDAMADYAIEKLEAAIGSLRGATVARSRARLQSEREGIGALEHVSHRAGARCARWAPPRP